MIPPIHLASPETSPVTTTFTDEHRIRHALTLAERARAAGEAPVGAVLVKDGEIVGEGWNCPISTNGPHRPCRNRRLAGVGSKAGAEQYAQRTLRMYRTLMSAVISRLLSESALAPSGALGRATFPRAIGSKPVFQAEAEEIAQPFGPEPYFPHHIRCLSQRIF